MTALDLIRTHVGGPLCYDHFAFRTFGVRIILVLGFMIHMVFCMENSRQIQDIHICSVGLNTALKHQTGQRMWDRFHVTSVSRFGL
jgi:hypothetical protein